MNVATSICKDAFNVDMEIYYAAANVLGMVRPTLMHISEHSDHPFRDYTIADFAIIRSPIPRFSGHF